MAVSQFMRHMSAAKWVVIEAAIHRDTGYARRVNTRAAHVTDAEVADMTTTNDSAADGPHVSSAEATDMTAAKAATAARKDCTTRHCYANHHRGSDCENSSVTPGFHGWLLFSNGRLKLDPEGLSFQYRLAFGMIEKIDFLLHQTVAGAFVIRITSDC
jgi:hypothetical protein